MGKIDIPVAEAMAGERYFEIRNCGADGCGSFHTFAVTKDTPIEDIMQIAADEHTAYMTTQQERYYPSIFSRPPYWRPTLKVVEKKRIIYKLDPEKDKVRIERTGRNYGNDWSTLRGGDKFTITNSYLRIKTNLGIHEYNGYKPGVLAHSKTAFIGEIEK